MNTEEIHFNLHLVNFLIVSGILQSFILAGILFFKKSDYPLPGKLLSLTILAICMHLSYLMILDLNLDNQYPFSLWIPYSYLTAVGPLIFLYTKSLLNKQFRLTKVEIMLFLPVILEVALQVAQIIYSSINDVIYYNTPTDFILSPDIYIAGAISIFFYSRRSLKIIRTHEKWARRNFSDLKNLTLSWLYQLLFYHRALWLLWIPFAIVFSVFFRLQIQNFVLILIIYGLILGITYLTYWIGIEGLRRVSLVFFDSKDSPQNEIKTYDKIPPNEIKNHIDTIVNLMTTERLFLKENLSLRDLSNQMDIDPNLLSYILNAHVNKSFHEFVNTYRVNEVKNKLDQAKYKNHTLLAIALESGFNSKTSFNRVFKQITGMTPSQYQKSFRAK
ncbi:MAG: helix-turn-helix domain-containing protein [Bacteroidota bacterium]